MIRQGIREAERSQQLSEIQSRAHDIVQATVTRVDPENTLNQSVLGSVSSKLQQVRTVY